jgi:hypothetical protein
MILMALPIASGGYFPEPILVEKWGNFAMKKILLNLDK